MGAIPDPPVCDLDPPVADILKAVQLQCKFVSWLHYRDTVRMLIMMPPCNWHLECAPFSLNCMICMICMHSSGLLFVNSSNHVFSIMMSLIRHYRISAMPKMADCTLHILKDSVKCKVRCRKFENQFSHIHKTHSQLTHIMRRPEPDVRRVSKLHTCCVAVISYLKNILRNTPKAHL